MKKYLVLFHDTWVPEPEIQSAWQRWFAAVGDRFLDSGTPFGTGVEVSASGARRLTAEEGPSTGYCLVSADSLDAAVALLADCPFSSTVRVYEAMAM